MSSTSDVDLLVEFAPDSRASFSIPAMQREFSQLFGHRRVIWFPGGFEEPLSAQNHPSDLQVLYEAR